MTLKEQNNTATDAAWNKLYQRIEQDGLLLHQNTPKRKRFTPSVLGWVAAILILCLGVGSVIVYRQTSAIDSEMMVIHNRENGSVLVSTLEDGSVVYLKALTSLNYPQYFETDKRQVFLKGNAFFDISPHKNRPFLINTQQATIEVLGTSFSIEEQDNAVFALSVRSGRVKVTNNENNEVVYATIGETVWIDNKEIRISKTNKPNAFAEYFQKIHFKDERLADVAHVINLNTDQLKLQVAPELADRLLTMTFAEETPPTMSKLICLAMGIQSEQRGDTIYLSPR